jgi:hypothetical protein|uniref:RagB/SusD family nutrient uptake outer membrane protein n=1 Tax=Bacteroides eggerthii TaxID=28111 RepID=UPI00359C73FC
MKIFKYMITALCLMGLGTSCIDLTHEDSTNVQLDDFLKNENDLKLYVYSLYKPFCSSNGDANVWGFYATLDGGYYALTENTTDILTSEKTNVEAASIVCNTHDWDMNSSKNITNPVYQKFMPKLSHLSKARMAALRIIDTDISNKEKYAAEAKAVLGWTGMILYDMFGPLPYASDDLLRQWDGEPMSGIYLPRPTPEEFLGYLQKNLEEAIPELPEVQEPWGRVTKGAASMLLLRIHLMQKDFESAKRVAKSVYEMGAEGGGKLYGLLDDYQRIFSIDNSANKEMILAVPCDGTKDYSPNQWYCAAMPADFVHASSFAKGSSTHRMRWAFYDTYEKGDLRLNTIVAEYVNNKGKKVKRGDKNLSQGALPFKYDQDPTTNGNFAKNDIVVLRYAEAILAYAEAINETEGPTKQAIDLLNLVRKRAGLKGIETIDNGDKVSSKEAFRDAILEERGHELYCEGVRHMDLVRMGKFVEYGKRGLSKYAEGRYNEDPHRCVFPIDPQLVIDSKGIIEQNEAYK